MKIRKKLQNMFSINSSISLSTRIAEWCISGVFGAVFGAIFTGQYLWSLFAFVVISVALIAYVIVYNHVHSKCDILKIMKLELDAGNCRQVIMIGYPLSRPLHLSGRNTLRHEIGELILQACNRLDPNTSIRINDVNTPILYIKAMTLIDDLGWTAFKLKRPEEAREKINEGIKIARGILAYPLVVKGYRHLIGICDESGDDKLRDSIESEARIILESDEYRLSFDDENKYIHAKAEYDYAYAKTLIDDKPEEALRIALQVQMVFSDEATADMDRFVKTYGLIGDIYAGYDRVKRLQDARRVYLEGINECNKYGRSERLIRIAIDYIKLLLKMIDKDGGYNSDEMDNLDKEELRVYKTACDSAKRIENGMYLSQLKKAHKKYLVRRRRKI